MKTSVCKIFSFDAAHSLPNYPGKCQRLHGHTWKLEVRFSGEVDEQTGMVADFAGLKGLVDKEIIGFLDHTLLNIEVENPTCENLLCWIWKRLSKVQLVESAQLDNLKLWETPDSYAELTNG